jgi:hypothetical protein
MLVQHCTLEFHQFGISDLDTQASQVFNGIYTNPGTFPAPPVTEVNFTANKSAFSTAAADYTTYGLTKKATFIAARKVLINDMDGLADYVDSVALGNESIIVLSGFNPSTAAAQKNLPVEKIPFFTAKHADIVGEITIEIPAILNRGYVNYSCICCEGAPLTNPVLQNGQIKIAATDGTVRNDVSKSRKKTFTGLTPGTVYYFYVYASNSVSVSPLSDAKSIMAA